MAREYLKDLGVTVAENGYSIVLIRPGSKRPYGKDWETTEYTTGRIKAAIAKGRGGFGVGIKTRHTPAVDIDCYDEDVVDHMREFTRQLVGETLERVGQPPKTLMVYRTDRPFRKVQSTRYLDDQGRSVKLEVLGDGQQFVCFHIHPDTKKPYRWADKQAPHNTSADELAPLNEDQAREIADEFDRIALERGWKKASTALAKRQARGTGELDFDDPFISDASKIELSFAEIKAKLHMAPGADDYDTWFQVGMALHHQFDGSDDGLTLWHEWSAQSDKYDMAALDEKWPTFEIEGKKRRPTTARFILKLSQEEEARIAGEELSGVLESIQTAPDLPALRLVMEQIKGIAFDQMIRETLVVDLRKRIKEVSGTSMSVTLIRRLIRYENPEIRHMPPWLEGFVYVQMDENFYSTVTGQSLSKRAFDDSFSRFMLTKKDVLEGNTKPEHSASEVALNRLQIPTVANRMYLPGEDTIFTIDGLDYVNTYSDAGVPAEPEKFTRAGREAISIVEGHLAHLFEDESERELLLDFMCYIVQNPGKRVNWCPIIQGAETDGKTWFYMLMGTVLGANNVQSIPGEALMEKNTAWAEGYQFCFVEEIRLHGVNRFDVVNKVKPYITNAMVSIRRMQVDWYKVVNTVNYMMATNFKDAMPIGKNDSRYFPLFSRWQTPESIAKFKRANPHYYRRLYGCLEHGEQLRKWMLERELSPLFDPNERAPKSKAKSEMIFLNQSEEEEALETALDESRDPLFCRELLAMDLLDERLASYGAVAPTGRLLKQTLSQHGFAYLGRIMVNGERHRLWSQTPEKFYLKGVVSTIKVKQFIERKAGNDDDI